MEDVKRKVMLDLFASPGTLIPIVGGLSALMFSWAVGGNPAANAVGIIGVLGGVGHFASRIVLGLENMTQRAYEAIVQGKREEQQQQLDDLAERLQDDDDPRTETCLKDLRSLYEKFQDSCEKDNMVANHHQVVGQVEQIFHASVKQLQRSLELFEFSRKLSPAARNEILSERDQVISEVIETRGHLTKVIDEFQSFATRREKSDLSRLRDELDETLRVAKKTEERMATIGHTEKNYDESEFE